MTRDGTQLWGPSGAPVWNSPTVDATRGVLYFGTGQMDAIFSTPIYVGASLEAGNAWQSRSDVRLDSLIYSSSLFLGVQIPLGPLFLGYGYAQGGHNSIYLTFGSLLRPSP